MQTHAVRPPTVPDPIPLPLVPPPSEPPDANEEEAAWLRDYEAHMRMIEEAECSFGCDYPEGPLSPEGCYW